MLARQVAAAKIEPRVEARMTFPCAFTKLGENIRGEFHAIRTRVDVRAHYRSVKQKATAFPLLSL
jgi:hypothetical protein